MVMRFDEAERFVERPLDGLGAGEQHFLPHVHEGSEGFLAAPGAIPLRAR